MAKKAPRGKASAQQAWLPGWEPPVSQAAAAAAGEPEALTATAPGIAAIDGGVLTEPQKPSGPVSLRDASIYIVDAYSLIFQVFHAIPEMTSPTGQPVNAIFGFTRDLLNILRDKKPTYLLCAFDLSGPTFRDEIYTEYKAHRSEIPDELVPQFDPLREMVTALGVPILELEGYEADDILATVARIADEEGARCAIVSSDKDCRQLISDKVRIYNVRKNQFLDAELLQKEWGIRPDQVVDFQALVGDSVDNVPGVPLIGPKIAGQLLQQYGTLDEILSHAGEVAGAKRRENLQLYRDQALLSRELVRLDRNVPVEIDWHAARAGQIDARRALELCGEFGFHRIAEDIRAIAPPPPPAPWPHTYHLVSTPEQFAGFVELLAQQPRFALSSEAAGASPRSADLVGCAFAWQPGEAWYVAVHALEGEPRLDRASTLAALKPFLENPAIGKLGHNLKQDQIVLRRAGIELRGIEFDSMIASYLLNAGERSHTLKELSLRHLNHPVISTETLLGKGKQQKRFDEVSAADMAEFVSEAADVPLRLAPLLAPELEKAGLTALFRDVELPLVDVLADLEYLGIRIDPERLGEMSRQFGAKMADIEAEIYRLAGRPFNIGSPKQLQQILFEELKLPVVRRIPSGASTDADVLEELAASHPLPAKILEYRQYAKLKNTYVDALPAMILPETGRVHASFNQVVAATGRLSSSDPNLQNIPIRTDEGREIRSAFLPGQPGWLLVSADYSQIELRVLAHFSGDETLRQAFQEGQDIHALVAAQVNNVPLAEVTDAQRREAKAVNFGVIYGQSAFGLANGLNIPREEAQRFIDAYFARYVGVERFLTETLDFARSHGYVQTILGRRRAINGVRRVISRQKNLPERTAINTVIQGSAADLIKLAMIAIRRRLAREGLAARMLLQIHDELVFETPAEEAAALRALVVEEMVGVLPLSVPLGVDVSTGPNWLDVE